MTDQEEQIKPKRTTHQQRENAAARTALEHALRSPKEKIETDGRKLR
jgi:hypothetical protein